MAPCEKFNDSSGPHVHARSKCSCIAEKPAVGKDFFSTGQRRKQMSTTGVHSSRRRRRTAASALPTPPPRATCASDRHQPGCPTAAHVHLRGEDTGSTARRIDLEFLSAVSARSPRPRLARERFDSGWPPRSRDPRPWQGTDIGQLAGAIRRDMGIAVSPNLPSRRPRPGGRKLGSPHRGEFDAAAFLKNAGVDRARAAVQWCEGGNRASQQGSDAIRFDGSSIPSALRRASGTP